jgi:hypothetical protein
MREGTDKYDDTEKGGYSYPEKLAMVAAEQMDPQEIGLPPNEDGNPKGARAAQEELEDKPKIPKLGDFVTFEASIVPPALRAHWARQDLAIQPDNARVWEAEWCEEHKNEFAIQAMLHSGAMAARIGQLFSDPILGFVELMRKSADILEEKYNELKKTDPNPIITREEANKKIATV